MDLLIQLRGVPTSENTAREAAEAARRVVDVPETQCRWDSDLSLADLEHIEKNNHQLAAKVGRLENELGAAYDAASEMRADIAQLETEKKTLKERIDNALSAHAKEGNETDDE